MTASLSAMNNEKLYTGFDYRSYFCSLVIALSELPSLNNVIDYGFQSQFVNDYNFYGCLNSDQKFFFQLQNNANNPHKITSVYTSAWIAKSWVYSHCT